MRVWAGREVREAALARVEALQAEEARSGQLFEEGRAARVSVLRARAAVSDASAELSSARTGVDLAERLLARASGMSVDQVSGRPFSAPRADFGTERADLEGRASALDTLSHPSLSVARGQLTRATATRDAASSTWLPTFSANGALNHFNSDGGFNQTEWQLGLALSYPIFTGMSRSRSIDRATAEVHHATAAYQAEKLRVADEMDRAAASITNAEARVRALQLAVEQHEEVTRIEALALEVGTGTQTDYLTALAALFAARAGLASARAAWVVGRAMLAEATGELSPEWVERNLEVQR
jgi:outer membrane protein